MFFRKDSNNPKLSVFVCIVYRGSLYEVSANVGSKKLIRILIRGRWYIRNPISMDFTDIRRENTQTYKLTL